MCIGFAKSCCRYNWGINGGRTPYHHQKAKIGTSSTNVIITVYIGFNQPAGKASLRMVSESTCKRKRLEIPFAQSWRTI